MLGDHNRWRGSNKYSNLLTRSIYLTIYFKNNKICFNKTITFSISVWSTERRKRERKREGYSGKACMLRIWKGDLKSWIMTLVVSGASLFTRMPSHGLLYYRTEYLCQGRYQSMFSCLSCWERTLKIVLNNWSILTGQSPRKCFVSFQQLSKSGYVRTANL